MKINYIVLNNIGPYVGNHKFEFETNSKENIILIGGKNGAGKTTLLKSIKYALFGSYALGLKTDTSKYFQEIKNLINNSSKENFYIEISFDYIENFEVKSYILKRSWKYVDDNLDEHISIRCDDDFFDDYETKEISDKIKAMTSPQLINSFIFDGEKISSIVENGMIPIYLEQTFNSIFSIDLIWQTKRDLENYISKRSEETKSKSQIENINLISKINSLLSQIATLESELSKYKNILNNLQSVKKSNYDNFCKLGGIDKIQQEKYSKKLAELDKEKEQTKTKIREFIETDLPLVVCQNILLEAKLQCHAERHTHYFDMLEEIETFVSASFPAIRKELEKKVTIVEKIHNLEISQIQFIDMRCDDISTRSAAIRSYVQSKALKTDEYKFIKRKLSDNENIETINKLIAENKSIDEDIKKVRDVIKGLESTFLSLKNDLELTQEIYNGVKENEKKSSLYDFSFSTGKTAYDLCNKFINVVTKNKLSKISSIALNIFKDTIRKSDFITHLDISPDFNLILKNANGVEIEPKTLSAGEMQILVSSLIWAMFKLSGRREMFVFDTPLARLDDENRINFIKKIISTISSQVVILSTDSEFVGNNLKVIENNIYKKYLLEYDVKTNSTNVTEDYFGGNK